MPTSKAKTWQAHLEPQGSGRGGGAGGGGGGGWVLCPEKYPDSDARPWGLGYRGGGCWAGKTNECPWNLLSKQQASVVKQKNFTSII